MRVFFALYSVTAAVFCRAGGGFIDSMPKSVPYRFLPDTSWQEPLEG